MRPLNKLALHGLAVLGLLASGAAQAQVRCAMPAEQTAFEIGALKSELTVLATSCAGADKPYNAFVERYRSTLVSSDAAVNAWFKRTYGRSAQRQYDAYITSLINAQSENGLKQGTNFCPRTQAMFTEVMALPSERTLPQYAAGKDVLPADVGACQPPYTAPVAVRARRAVTKHK